MTRVAANQASAAEGKNHALTSERYSGESRAAGHRWPLLSCLAAGFATSFTPVILWRLKTGDWLCINQADIIYYLQIASGAYFNHPSYISDPVVQGGATFYTWLQFVPAVYLARALGLSPFSITLIWHLWAAIGMSAGAYFVFWRFIGHRWLAAGCTIFLLSDAGVYRAHPIVMQVRELAQALGWMGSFARLDSLPLYQWRIPDPALDFPLLFVEIVAVSIARQRPARLSLGLSGLAFGALFYLYFYAWTMAAAGLCIALAVDRGGRRVYARTLLIGSALGVPELVHDFLMKRMASPEAVVHQGFFAWVPRNVEVSIPRIGLLVLTVSAIWIWRTKRSDLVGLWSLAAAGLLLSRSRLITGIYLHDYHWDWFWLPLLTVLLVVMAANSIPKRMANSVAFIWLCPAFLMVYLGIGVYLTAEATVRTATGAGFIEEYQQYRAQRRVPGVQPLAPLSTIAGENDFCDLATIGENQRPLSGYALPLSMAVDDLGLATRRALNAVLLGVGRTRFEAQGRRSVWYWYDPQRRDRLLTDFIRDYDEDSRDPSRHAEAFGVRYVAIRAKQVPPSYLRNGWKMIQPGPYWQIWERERSGG